MNAPAVRRLHVERLELELRGIDPATARAAVQALGPALARALATGAQAASADRPDARNVAPPADPAPGALADTLAHTLARRLRGGTP